MLPQSHPLFPHSHLLKFHTLSPSVVQTLTLAFTHSISPNLTSSVTQTRCRQLAHSLQIQPRTNLSLFAWSRLGTNAKTTCCFATVSHARTHLLSPYTLNLAQSQSLSAANFISTTISTKSANIEAQWTALFRPDVAQLQNDKFIETLRNSCVPIHFSRYIETVYELVRLEEVDPFNVHLQNQVNVQFRNTHTSTAFHHSYMFRHVCAIPMERIHQS
jgi:hypothetical protein